MRRLLIPVILLIIHVSGCSNFPGYGQEKSLPKTIFVGSEKVDCVNRERNNLCYQIKEHVDEEWSLYKGEIMGFLFEPGFIYELVVQADTMARVSGDAPDVQWVLLERVSKVSMQPQAQEIEWRDIPWILTQFGKSDALRESVGAELPNVTFRNDGQLTGSSGCNRFNGVYAVGTDLICVSNLAASKAMCPSIEGMLEQEQTIFYVFQQSGQFELKGEQLFIYSREGDQLLVFKRQ